MPISTTHAAASLVVGAGVGSGKGANWKVVGEMVLAWVVTIPTTGAIAFGLFSLTRLPGVLAWITIGIIVVGFSAWAVRAMMRTIHAADVEAEIPHPEALNGFDHVEPHLKGGGPVT